MRTRLSECHSSKRSIATLFRSRFPNSWRRSPLNLLKRSSEERYRRLVEQIQMKCLDHPTSSKVWQFADREKLIDRIELLLVRFDENANAVWSKAWEMFLKFY